MFQRNEQVGIRVQESVILKYARGPMKTVQGKCSWP